MDLLEEIKRTEDPQGNFSSRFCYSDRNFTTSN
jgi:hypothetical protein